MTDPKMQQPDSDEPDFDVEPSGFVLVAESYGSPSTPVPSKDEKTEEED